MASSSVDRSVDHSAQSRALTRIRRARRASTMPTAMPSTSAATTTRLQWLRSSSAEESSRWPLEDRLVSARSATPRFRRINSNLRIRSNAPPPPPPRARRCQRVLRQCRRTDFGRRARQSGDAGQGGHLRSDLAVRRHGRRDRTVDVSSPRRTAVVDGGLRLLPLPGERRAGKHPSWPMAHCSARRRSSTGSSAAPRHCNSCSAAATPASSSSRRTGVLSDRPCRSTSATTLDFDVAAVAELRAVLCASDNRQSTDMC